MLRILIAIGLGGCAGSILRWLTSRWLSAWVVASFPLGTFVVNILGCFCLGLLYGWSERGHLLSEEWRLFLTVGLCGGFTTFSTFAGENVLMLRDGAFLYAALYIGLSVVAGLLAVYGGMYLTKLS
jgi:CrcB protein